MHPLAPLSPATIAELPWFFLLLIFAVISEKERQESERKEKSMIEEMERMKEKIRAFEGEKRELETWKEEDVKKTRKFEEERREWSTWKTAALKREESHHRQLSLSYQKTFIARLHADRAESALCSANTSFDLERAEWEDEKGKLIRDLEKVRREDKGIVYLRARIATAEAGMRFWEREYRGKNKESSAN